MKRELAALLLLAWMGGSGAWARAGGVEAMNERELDGVLTSSASPAEKDAACARLKRIGTEQSIPALAALLANPELSHSARYALEPMSSPKAGEALLGALNKTTGSNQWGIINSLAARREVEAVPELEQFLKGSDEGAAMAAAQALARIGSAKSVKSLESAAASVTGQRREAVWDALLACANESLRRGEKKAAAKIFRRILDDSKNDAMREASFRGLILASDDASVAIKAIRGSDVTEQGAALRLAAQLPGGAATTKELADLLPEAAVPVRIALLQCLQQRGDSTAVPTVAKVLNDADVHVREGALAALGDLGDGSVARPLAERAAAANGEERAAARQALVDLRRGDAGDAIAAACEGAPTGVAVELIHALGDRGEASAAGALIQMAQGRDEALRAAALQALALTADQGHVGAMVQLISSAGSDDARAEAAEALGSACQHIEAEHGHCDAGAVAEAARSGSAVVRIALLPVCGELSEESTRGAVREGLKDSDTAVREAAQRSLCEARDAGLLPDLLGLTTASDNKKIRALAIRGTVRLTTQEENVKLSNEAKLAALKQIADEPLDAPEKKTVLAGLGAIPSKESVALIMGWLGDSEVQTEAAEAVIRIADGIDPTGKEDTRAALQKVLALQLSAPTHAAAQKALQKLQ